MKKIDLDIASLIAPLIKAPKPTSEANPPEACEKPKRIDYPLMLATAIRTNRIILPQVELLGKQMTSGPSPLRYIQFGRYEVADRHFSLAVTLLSDIERKALRDFLWTPGNFVKDEKGYWVEFSPEFTSTARRAFTKVLAHLRNRSQLRNLTRSLKTGGDDDGRTAL